MNGYLQITLIVISFSIISGYIGGGANRIERMIQHSAFYFGILSGIRAWQGNQLAMLGQSFAEKNLTGYLKAVGVMTVIGVALVLAEYSKQATIKNWIRNTSIVFYATHLLTIILFTIPNNSLTSSEFLISGAIEFVISISPQKCERDTKQSPGILTVSIAAYLMLFLVAGPTEIFSFNKTDYKFVFREYIGTVFICFFFYIVCAGLLEKYLFGEKLNKIVSTVVVTVAALSYIQTMLLNGHMQELHGQITIWDRDTIIINVVVWVIITAIIATGMIIFLRKGILKKAILYTSIIIILLQGTAFFGSVIQGDIWQANPRRVFQDEVYTLGTEENLIIILLDAYGVDVINYVLQGDPDFLAPLKDFTYYDNVEGKFLATHPTMHMFLTGHTESIKEIHYKDSSFIKDLNEYGYHTSIYSDSFLVTEYADGLIANIVDYPAVFDMGRLAATMMKSAKYRGAPYVFKKIFEYTTIDFSNTIEDSNLWSSWDDRAFYMDLTEEDLNIDKNIKNRFVFYHLLGAHVPYWLRENMEYDYSTEDPLAQARASMKIVYEYLDRLKSKGLYNAATIIVMADHGEYIEMEEVIMAAGIEELVGNKPIMFIKRPYETHDDVIIDDNAVTNERFQATIIKLIDPDNESYGKAVWER